MRNVETIFREVESIADFIGHNIDSATYTNGYGDMPLHVVANWGDCEAISILVNAGANIDAVGESGFTPLHCAAEQNKADAILLLRRLGAAIVQDDAGDTPLELACLLGNKEAIDALRQSI
ncbi:ankyrin repeat domain-containing protein [Microbulbifer sp. SSSA002]|uniref:ankyrin repeat domain-containing protein n=1 Tax=unclassified Microbulbifer TaxID=2619833 RepID=UPI0040393656